MAVGPPSNDNTPCWHVGTCWHTALKSLNDTKTGYPGYLLNLSKCTNICTHMCTHICTQLYLTGPLPSFHHVIIVLRLLAQDAGARESFVMLRAAEENMATYGGHVQLQISTMIYQYTNSTQKHTHHFICKSGRLLSWCKTM